jgi:arginine decarboxylase-like protein
MNYEKSEIMEGVWRQLRKCVDKDTIKEVEAKSIAKEFEALLAHYTYLDV